MPLAHRAALMAHRANRAINGFPADYIRGAIRVPVTACPAKSLWETVDEYGTKTVTAMTDWLVTVTELARIVTPQHGDRIELIRADRRETYEVAEPPGADTPYRDHDAAGQTFRIHTNKIR